MAAHSPSLGALVFIIISPSFCSHPDDPTQSPDLSPSSSSHFVMQEAERLLMEIIDVSLNHKWVNILEGLHAIASAMR